MVEERVRELFRPILSSTVDLIRNLENQRTTKVVTLICFDYPLMAQVGYIFNKILRKLGEIERLDLFIESSGGDINVAAKIVKLCRAYSKDFKVIVPYYAKSAATFIALSSNEIIMPKSAELGPVDPIVKHPALVDMWIPAHSIKDALEFIESTADPYVKLSMAEKLDPLLIGAFQDAIGATTQYITEAFDRLPEDKREAVIAAFTKKYRSHGYPIDRELCKENGLNVKFPDEAEEEIICDLHEIYMDALLANCKANALVVQTTSHYYAIIDNLTMHGSTEELKGEKEAESITSKS